MRFVSRIMNQVELVYIGLKNYESITCAFSAIIILREKLMLSRYNLWVKYQIETNYEG